MTPKYLPLSDLSSDFQTFCLLPHLYHIAHKPLKMSKPKLIIPSSPSHPHSVIKLQTQKSTVATPFSTCLLTQKVIGTCWKIHICWARCLLGFLEGVNNEEAVTCHQATGITVPCHSPHSTRPPSHTSTPHPPAPGTLVPSPQIKFPDTCALASSLSCLSAGMVARLDSLSAWVPAKQKSLPGVCAVGSLLFPGFPLPAPSFISSVSISGVTLGCPGIFNQRHMERSFRFLCPLVRGYFLQEVHVEPPGLSQDAPLCSA